MNELGLLLAFISAIAYGVRNFYQKVAVDATDEYVSGWAKRAFAAVATIPAVAVLGIPKIDLATFAPVLLLNTAIGVTATILVQKAYKQEEVSFLSPLGALSPIPLLITSPILIGEFPSTLGLVGVLVVVSGTYLLKIDSSTGLLDPLKRVFTNRAAHYLFATMLIYSVSANLDKIAVKASSPVMWSFSLTVGSAIGLFPIMVHKTDNWVTEVRQEWRSLTVFGVAGAIGSVFQMAAIAHTLVIYQSAIKRFSIPVAVILGLVFLGERNAKGRLVGTVLVTIGGILIALA